MDEIETMTPEMRYVVDRGFARRLGVATVRVTVAKSGMLLAYSLLVAAFVVLGFAGWLPLGGMWWLIPAAFVGFYLVLAGLLFHAQVRVARAQLPTGSLIACRFGEESFWESTPQGVSVVRYDTYEHLWVSNGFVLFKARRGSVANVLPVEVIPGDDWLAHIWGKLAVR